MANLKDIFNPREYERIGRRLDNRLEEIKRIKSREKGIQEKEEILKMSKRKMIMNYLHNILSDELYQKYTESRGGFCVYRAFNKTIYLKRDGVYLRFFGGKEIEFDEGGRAITYVERGDCWMAAPVSIKIEYDIEDIVKDMDEFKEEVSINIRKRIGSKIKWQI